MFGYPYGGRYDSYSDDEEEGYASPSSAELRRYALERDESDLCAEDDAPWSGEDSEGEWMHAEHEEFDIEAHRVIANLLVRHERHRGRPERFRQRLLNLAELARQLANTRLCVCRRDLPRGVARGTYLGDAGVRLPPRNRLHLRERILAAVPGIAPPELRYHAQHEDDVGPFLLANGPRRQPNVDEVERFLHKDRARAAARIAPAF